MLIRYLLHQLLLDHVTFFNVFFNLFIFNNCVSSSDISVKSFDNVKMESTSKGKSQLFYKSDNEEELPVLKNVLEL